MKKYHLDFALRALPTATNCKQSIVPIQLTKSAVLEK